MRVGLILPGFSASESDWCIPAHLNLVRRLAEQAEVHVFPLRYPHHRRPYPVYGATVHPQGGANTRKMGRIVLLQRAIAAVIAQHRRRPLDVLHAIWVDEPGIVAVVAGQLLRVPTVLTLLGGELVRLPDIGYGGQLSRLNRWFVRVALRAATRVTAGSAYLRRLAQPYVRPGQILALPIGVDTEMFYPQTGAADPSLLTAGDIKLLHAASLVPVKDQATLLRGVARIVQQMPEVHLHILGQGPLRNSLEHLAAALEIADHVTFHGAVPYEQMPAYFHAADLCALSSRHEGQELVTLEAAACGRSTVGTSVGVLPDLMPATRAVPVRDDRMLAEALLAILQDRQQMAEMGQASLAAIQAHYTLRQTVTEFLDLYAELAEEQQRKVHV